MHVVDVVSKRTERKEGGRCEMDVSLRRNIFAEDQRISDSTVYTIEYKLMAGEPLSVLLTLLKGEVAR
jgi:hypothetical protein